MKSPIENLPFIPRLVLGLVLFVYGIISLWLPSISKWFDFASGFALSFGFIMLLTLLPEAKEKMKRN
ncbi:MAG: hypothetical protein ACK4R6_04840 [Spirosomataceae bacterium]